jgi:hypothetical protein
MKFYEQMEYTYEENKWHNLFAAAALSEGDPDWDNVKVSDEECFFSAPSLGHIGRLSWKTSKFVYHAAAISSVVGIDFIVVPEGGNGFNVRNFWFSQKELIWEIPEVVYIPDDNALDIDDCYH